MPVWDPKSDTPRDGPAMSKGYHAHCYFTAEQQPYAEKLRKWLLERFVSRGEDGPPYAGDLFQGGESGVGGGCHIGLNQKEGTGPHTRDFFLCAFHPRVFAEIVPFLMMNHGPLSILIHPETGEMVEDHELNPLWLGAPLPFNFKGLGTALPRSANKGLDTPLPRGTPIERRAMRSAASGFMGPH
eukprot:TRINITY_DN86415_c0_g1_i1.p1 TRINITY_DN86415_c0_g1~~TRINITY_DN86415_c0_g1_i1.p1  ORF type:complete len:207 (+),score=19.96 TRINITY_DN86415_c0_g1_i1:67-621(+)